MEFALSKKQEEIVEKAAWVARDFLAPRAATYDEAATHPVENWNDLWEQGLLTAAVPKEYGGLGLDMQTYVMVIEQLAQGCTSTAMTMHMHSVVQRYIDALATPEQKATFYPDVANAASCSEAGVASPKAAEARVSARPRLPTGRTANTSLMGRSTFARWPARPIGASCTAPCAAT